ncbi:peptidase S28 [Mycena floridula]|nr:peptidase S28 [Mycena floridula]
MLLASKFSFFFAFLLPFAAARLDDGRLHANLPPRPSMKKIPVPPASLPDISTVYYFDQLIDHQNPSRGTFKQRYWHTWEFYEPGGPIILSTPGESNADGFEGYLTNSTINGLIAQQQKGATVVIEHRFFGLSNPLPDLSVQSLQYLTIQQAIDDLVYFATNVKLPMPGGDKVGPKQAPWILIGGSYSGALTSWTMVNKPGVFFAGYSSSGVVQAITDYWAYFEPIRQSMPRNCSADVQAVISHFDQVFSSGNITAINELKTMYSLQDVIHADDAVGSLRNTLWEWQSLQITSGPNAAFYQFCDALEIAPAEGWGLDYALPTWGKYHGNVTLRNSHDCLSTYNTNQTWWTDSRIDNASRSWQWMVCNEVGYFQDSPPTGQPALVSRLIGPAYDERQCSQMFPEQFANKKPGPSVDATNALYQGWNVTVDRLFFANGQKDPWRDATVSADGLSIQIGDGIHCSDLGTVDGQIDPTIRAVQKQALTSMKSWLSTWSPPTSRMLRPRWLPRNPEPINSWVRGSSRL